MKKMEITFNQLVAGALLKFGKLDSVDITLLMVGLNKIASVINIDCEHVDEYFMMASGEVLLNEKYINKVSKGINNTMLERIQGNIVKEYMDNLNIEEFVLRKIKLLGLGCVPRDDIIHTFSVLQIATIKRLYKKGLIIDYLHKDCIYGDYQAIKLTKRGVLYLFLIDNKDKVEKFMKLLSDNGYNSLLVEAFLITQDLEKNVGEILTIDNFLTFCDEFDIEPSVDAPTNSHYSRIRVPEKK